MFTEITWQDWQNEPDKAKATLAVIGAYKHSEDFDKAGIAQRYYEAKNDTVSAKVVLQATTSETEQTTADQVSRSGSKRYRRISSSIPAHSRAASAKK